jgi:hypothetical protein
MPPKRATKQTLDLFDEDSDSDLEKETTVEDSDSELPVGSSSSPPKRQQSPSPLSIQVPSTTEESSSVGSSSQYVTKSSPKMKEEIFYDAEDSDSDSVGIMDSPREKNSVRFESESSNMYRTIRQLEARIGLLESQMKTLMTKPRILNPSVNLKIPPFLQDDAGTSQGVSQERPRSRSPTRKSRAKAIPKPHQTRSEITGRIINKPVATTGWYAYEDNGNFYNADDTFYNPTHGFASKRSLKLCEPCKFRNQKGTENNPTSRPTCKNVTCPNGTVCSATAKKCIPDGSLPKYDPSPEDTKSDPNPLFEMSDED